MYHMLNFLLIQAQLTHVLHELLHTSLMTKNPKTISSYHSHITNVLAMSMTLSHFLRMTTTLFRYISIREIICGTTLVCDIVVATNDKNACLNLCTI
jgi:hypothetical protein